MTAHRRGFLLGALGVVIFAMTMPMTRLAVGDASAPQLTPAFVTAGRAAVAGLLSLVYLLLVRARWRSAPWAPWSASRSASAWRCARCRRCTLRW